MAAYLVERAAEGTAVVSLNMACTAIRYVHRQHGLPNPAENELVRQVRLGLRRTYGVAPKRLARPLTVPDLQQIVAAIDRTKPIGVRDSAIILLGFASAMRGSELAHLRLADVPLSRIAAQTRHKDIGVLVNRYIRPMETLEMTSSKDLGL